MYDTDGYLHIIGRVKDAVITAQDQVIFPKEIEVLIDSVNGVNESAVIAVPGRNGYQLPVAVVVLTTGVDRSNIKYNILSVLNDELATHEIPKRFIFVEQLPRNVMGKVQKVTLRQQYKNLLVLAE